MNTGDRPSKPRFEVEETGGPGGARARRVLVAEDNAANRKLALAMLRKLGYTADGVANGLEAVEAVSASSYDAVLMDCRMPELDGFQATGEIRGQETESSRVPIIAMTADAMEGDRQRCLDAGMDDYLSKPVTFESLAAVLERWIPAALHTPGRAAVDWPASEGPPESVEPLDPGILAGLRQLGRGRDGVWMSGLVSEFLRDAGSNLERLRRAVESDDRPTIDDRSHALAGTAATFGASQMSRLCRRLRASGSQGNHEAARETLAWIEAEFERVRLALRAEFPGANEEDA